MKSVDKQIPKTQKNLELQQWVTFPTEITPDKRKTKLWWAEDVLWLLGDVDKNDKCKKKNMLNVNSVPMKGSNKL